MELQLKELLEIQELMSQNTTDAWNEQLQHTAKVVVLEPLDGVEYNGWADRFDAFIKKLQEPKADVLEKFAKRCDATGKGMNEGWVFNDGDYCCASEEDAKKYVESKTNEDGSPCVWEDELKLVDTDEEWFYWTQWEDVDDDDYYDADGNNYVDGELQ